jgi:peroxin-5
VRSGAWIDSADAQFVDGEDDTFDILERDLNRDDIGQTGLDEQMEFGTGAGLEGDFTAENGLPPQVQYHFANPNKFDVMSPVQAWNEANRLLSAGGSLSDSALMIETFLRRATNAEFEQTGVTRAAAWAVLGRTQAENEMEDKALAAFEEGRKTIADDPAARAVAGELLTNLAISYVNESLDLAALTTLHQLLETLHPTHAGQAPSRSEFIASDNPWALHQRMTNQYLALAREQYAAAGTVDPDVQVGLGTLYYMQGEFGEARSCWVAALGERPDDYLLWNRLGATLANGGDPEEAVDAYRRALEIKPTFTRAIANLGVACLNIGVHREAAEHFLAALALQPNDGGGGTAPEAYSLWATLRRALIALDQPQLAEQARPGTDLGVFRNAGFDF